MTFSLTDCQLRSLYLSLLRGWLIKRVKSRLFLALFLSLMKQPLLMLLWDTG